MEEIKHSFEISGSPHSSEEHGSLRGTPETKLTAFSPEEIPTGLKATAHVSAKSHVPPVYNLNENHRIYTPMQEQGRYVAGSLLDPFTTAKGSLANRGTNPIPKLSAVASEFEPSGCLATINENYGSASTSHLIPQGSSGYNATSAIGLLAANSIPDIPQIKSQLKNYPSSLTTDTVISPVSQGSFSSSLGSVTVINSPSIGPFSTDGSTSRYLRIASGVGRINAKDLEETFNVSYKSCKGGHLIAK